ncbi:DUF1481 domain-containing protein [Oleiagrimonas sp. C23AA]|uniref:DUF1481 domain-containing protein n=1 Tax=Oleiagrimonas sp. C23AA TaxID=2719047 RepID=UPI0014201E9E|nr:DUF1481 domain-containing protein [Oleiagrimonas sp. C23AA]NII12223.1 DUF1481 domain-containing protein [Oleiagrimonas sp. C23AA]
MRRIVLSLTMLAALGAAGCSHNNGSDNGSDADGQSQKAMAHSVSGTVSLTQPRQLSDQAKLTIKLVDASNDAAQPLASKTIAPVTQMPVQFKLDVDPSKVNPSDLYVVQAEMIDGQRDFTMQLQAPVLTKGASNTANIKLVAQATPEEKQLDDYKKVEQQIGGMKRTQGTKLEKGVSRAWQVFSQDGQIQFIRELVDYGKKGFTSTDFAYKDGQPWVAVQKKKPSQNAKPDAINRAGWDAKGNLTLQQHEVNGKVSKLSDSDAADLKKEAEAIYKHVDHGKKK